MLDLHESDAWQQLNDAYGPANRIPDLLQQLEGLPAYDDNESEPYYSLWSALCHQDDVYTASYAALPHLVRISRANAANPRSFCALHLAAAIETSRLRGHGPRIPEDLRDSYSTAVQLLPTVVAELSRLHRGEGDARIAMSAMAAAMGYGDLAYAAIDLLQR